MTMNSFRNSMKKDKIGKTLSLVVLGLAVVALFAFVLTYLWNWLMTDLFGLREITLIEGLGIFALSKIIFGGFSGESKDSKKTEIVSETEASKSNQSYDDLYDAWWKAEGESHFDSFIEKHTNNQ